MKSLVVYILKVALGIVCGLAVWWGLAIGFDEFAPLVMPAWYAAEGAAIEDALNRKNIPYAPTTAYLLIGLAAFAVFNVIAGFVAALVSRRRIAPPYLVGIALLCFWIIAISRTPLSLPFWYDLGLVATAVPLSVIGGRFVRKKR